MKGVKGVRGRGDVCTHNLILNKSIFSKSSDNNKDSVLTYKIFLKSIFLFQ